MTKALDKPQINIRLEPDVWENLHHFCFDHRLSKTEVVEAALKEYLGLSEKEN